MANRDTALIDNCTVSSFKADMVKGEVTVAFKVTLNQDLLDVKDILAWWAATEHSVDLTIVDRQYRMEMGLRAMPGETVTVDRDKREVRFTRAGAVEADVAGEGES